METIIVSVIVIFFGLVFLSFKTRNGQRRDEEGNTSQSNPTSSNTYTDASDDVHHHHTHSHSHGHHDGGGHGGGDC